jgi:hypothetical protein
MAGGLISPAVRLPYISSAPVAVRLPSCSLSPFPNRRAAVIHAVAVRGVDVPPSSTPPWACRSRRGWAVPRWRRPIRPLHNFVIDENAGSATVNRMPISGVSYFFISVDCVKCKRWHVNDTSLDHYWTGTAGYRYVILHHIWDVAVVILWSWSCMIELVPSKFVNMQRRYMNCDWGLGLISISIWK